MTTTTPATIALADGRTVDVLRVDWVGARRAVVHYATPDGYRDTVTLTPREVITGAADPVPTVEVFHRTTTAAAAAIACTGRMTSREAGSPVFASTVPDGHATGYGPAVVVLVVPEAVAELDDEFPDGERHYRIPAAAITPDAICGRWIAPGHVITERRTDDRRFQPGRFTVACSCGAATYTGCRGPGHGASVAVFHARDLAHAAGDHTACLVNTCAVAYGAARGRHDVPAAVPVAEVDDYLATYPDPRGAV